MAKSRYYSVEFVNTCMSILIQFFTGLLSNNIYKMIVIFIGFLLVSEEAINTYTVCNKSL